MVAKKFEELICWQLSDKLKVRVFEILKREEVRQDFDYCRQIRKSARSAPALIAEGFARRRTAEFKRYLEMALGELDETRNHLRDGGQCGYVKVDEFRELWHLCYRARRATVELVKYLAAQLEAEKQKRRDARKKDIPPPT